MNDLDSQIESARKNLLDLSMRNRLLHYRPTQTRSISVVHELPREVFDILVVQERSMRFRPGPEGESDDPDDAAAWTPPDDGDPSAEQVDRYLQTTLEPEALQKRLFQSYHQSRTAEEEQGFSMLFIALGFLEWHDSAGPRLAPLLLVPVRLQRTSVRKAFSVAWSGEEIFSNISLKEKLREYEIALPDFEQPDNKEDIDAYVARVGEAVSGMESWRIVNDVCLDFFSFTRFVMYRDLDSTTWPSSRSPSNHPLIRATLDPSSTPAPPASESSDGLYDPLARIGGSFQIMDADPFQVKVVEDAKAGRNLAVEGPPGTGKSQTIANIIAELLGSGKSVLFVSEKMAALEVVKGRLDSCGLGDFCLELHSRKANKREVLREIERSLKVDVRTPGDVDMDPVRHAQLAGELNDYVQNLQDPIGEVKLSPYELFEMREKAMRITMGESRILPHVTITGAGTISTDTLREIRTWIAALSEMMRLVVPVSDHPWKGCTPGMILPVDQDEISTLIEQCSRSVVDLQTEILRLCTLTGLSKPESIGALAKCTLAARMIASAPSISREALANPLWEQGTDAANMLIVDLNDVQRRVEFVMARFKTKALSANVAPVVDEFRLLAPGSLRFLNSRYRKVKQMLRGLYRVLPPPSDAVLISECDHLAACIRARKELSARKDEAVGLFGPIWKGDGTRSETLRSYVDWMVRFKESARSGLVTAETENIIATGADRSVVENQVTEVSTALEFLQAHVDALISRVGVDMDTVFGVPRDEVTFPQLLSRLHVWVDELDALPRWSQFTTARADCERTAAAAILPVVDGDQILPHELDSCFMVSFVDALMRDAVRERPSLAKFVGEAHERKIDEFAALDQQRIIANRKSLARILQQRRPRILDAPSEHSEAGILLGELGRKRGHMPIRQLMLRAGGIIRTIKPCFMMSPLSIAQFLDPASLQFDVVIMDEASQVRPEDALGALLRGKQLIVMGDTRQLPPTNFFEHLAETGDEQDAGVADIESILHQCKRVFPTRMLNWHYRSRHESLIAVPNREFYDDELYVFPSAIDNADHLGVQFVQILDSSYDRGRTSVNRNEARAVAGAALEHYRRYPGKSLGIGTFNTKQQLAVQEEVELLLRDNPGMEEFFSHERHEHFFVKNLETIQGDERDVIFISVGFGFDDDHRLAQNFGPLNQDGGHRRLNVLITRAREKCVVFANFRGSDLHVDEGSPFGVRALKTFLEFAEDRSRISRKDTAKASSAFIDTLHDVLVVSGYDVRKQAGDASFPVDLAIVDPESPESYVLGIETDGPKYHRSDTASERDRLRQQVLASLGWRIHRVWSMDWYRDRSATEARLLQAVAQSIANRGTPLPPGVLQAEQSVNEHLSVGSTEALVPEAPTLESLVPLYTVCTDPGVERTGELREERTPKLASAIEHIVAVEGPVHTAEVMKRIRKFWGVGKSGSRITTLLNEAIELAIKCDYAIRRGDFLWPTDNRRATVRLRHGEPMPDIDLICDEEIAEALALVLRHQFSTRPADLIVQASRLLGFQATREAVSSRIAIVLNNLVQAGILVAQANGNIGFTT